MGLSISIIFVVQIFVFESIHQEESIHAIPQKEFVDGDKWLNNMSFFRIRIELYIIDQSYEDRDMIATYSTVRADIQIFGNIISFCPSDTNSFRVTIVLIHKSPHPMNRIQCRCLEKLSTMITSVTPCPSRIIELVTVSGWARYGISIVIFSNMAGNTNVSDAQIGNRGNTLDVVPGESIWSFRAPLRDISIRIKMWSHR